MGEIPAEYYSKVAEQLVLISVFLGGISATILGTLMTNDKNSRLVKTMIVGLSLSAASFIVAVMSMTRVQMIVALDSPMHHISHDTPRLIGALSFFLGIYTLLFVISLSGWMQSKRIGIITTLIGIISGILAMIALA